jgi:hypothetical protein
MENKIKMILVFGILSLLVATMYVGLNRPSENVSVEKNYAGLYALGLIPNSVELPSTPSDIVIAVSDDGTKVLVDSPFGYVYERSIN